MEVRGNGRQSLCALEVVEVAQSTLNMLQLHGNPCVARRHVPQKRCMCNCLQMQPQTPAGDSVTLSRRDGIVSLAIAAAFSLWPTPAIGAGQQLDAKLVEAFQAALNSSSFEVNA